MRKVIFACFTILGVWLLLLGLRAVASRIVLDLMSQGAVVVPKGVSPDLSNWSNSYWSGVPVSDLIGQRIGATLQLVVYTSLLALGIAGLLLFLGVLLSRITERPLWLAKLRTVLRLVGVSKAVSSPIFLGIFPLAILVFPLGIFSWSPPIAGQVIPGWLVLYVSLLPAWLIVQAGHGELSRPFDSNVELTKHLAVTSVTRLLKLMGAIFVVAILAEQSSATPGLGRLLLQAVDTRDMPLAFGIAFILAVIVVLAKLVADLTGIAYNRPGKNRTTGSAIALLPSRYLIPKGWVIFSLVLVFVVILTALVIPAIAPYHFNEIILADRLSPPSAAHILGTDNLGRDVLSRLLFGIRLEVFSSLSVVAAISVVAFMWALLAAAVRNRHDWLGDILEDVVMLPRDIVVAFPWLVLLLILMSLIGGGIVSVGLMTGIVLLPHIVGMMRELSVSAPPEKSWTRSVLLSVPVVFILGVGGALLYISSIGYLGLGVPPPQPELGSMLAGSGRLYMITAPWVGQWPIIVLILLPLFWVMAGDALLEKLGFRSKVVWAKVME